MRFTRLFLLCAALAGGSSANASRTDEVAATVAEFKKFYKSNATPAEKIEAIHVLDRLDRPEAVEALVSCFDDPDFSVRQTAIDVLGGYRSIECAQWLIDNVVGNKRFSSKNVKVVAVSALAQMGHLIAAQPIVTLLKDNEPDIQRAAAAALGTLKAVDTVPELVKLLKSNDATIRIATLDAIGRIGEGSANPAVLEQLTDERWQVRSAAVNALGNLRQKESIPVLIDRLDAEEGRIRDEIGKALLSLTTFDFSDNKEKWVNWWETMKDRFKVPSAEEVAKAREAFEKAQLRYQPGADDFAGIPTKSKRILYVVDISGSMEDPLINRDAFKLQGRTYKSFVKMEVVKQELMRTIENLDDRVFFNVIAFATKVRKWNDKGLVAANILNRKNAAKWVEGLHPIGGASQNLKRAAGLSGAAGGSEGKTNFYDSLMTALDAKAAQAGYDTHLGSQVDTIFFLSDGDPTAGPMTENERILAEVRRVNQLRKIVIHTINIGKNERGKQLMAAIARENGGTFLDLGE
jgi:HEAT repeat protein